MKARVLAPAKINLTLHITGQRADGYHLLDSLVTFADVGDILTLTASKDMSIDVSGPFAQGVPTDSRNLVWRAAEAAGWCGHVTLEKNLPHGAGIGGGSADAAALLRNLFGHHVCDGIGLDAAFALGADVPVCLSAAPQRMQGVGERVSFVWPVPQLTLVLVNPGVHVATPDIFRKLENRKNQPMDSCDGWSNREQFVEWLSTQRNDLETTACAVAPQVAEALNALQDSELARMSGSGGTCFGIFPDEDVARSAARRIALAHPEWWVQFALTAG